MKKNKYTISHLCQSAIVFVCCLTSFTCDAQGKLLLIDRGKSNYTIIIPANATEIEKKAGNELQTYLAKISSVKLNIAGDNAPSTSNEILIGKTNRTNGVNYNALAEDGLLIKTDKNKLVLTGGTRKGVLYSVYTFLESYLGCRKYSSKISYIPTQQKVEIPANINNQQIPGFKYRTTHFIDAGDPSYADWHKLNYFFEGWGFYAHSFQTLLPPDKYFKQHPEYYALVNGKRVPDEPCLSNPDVLKIVIANLRTEMAKRPPRKYWSISQNDNNVYCQCDLCKPVINEEKTQQGPIIRFVNKVADAFPDKIISTLAYQYSIRAPKITRPNKNVLIMIAPIGAPRNIPIGQEAPINSHRQYITDWGKICNNDNLFVWDYIVQFTNVWAPYPNLYTLQPNLQFFQDNNVQYVFEQGFGEIEGEFSELRCYLIAKLMWNPQLNFNKVLDEFLTGYYGANAAPYIKKYINSIHGRLAQNTSVRMIPHGRTQDAAASYLATNNIKDYLTILNPALKKSEGTIYNDRVLKVILPLRFAWLDIQKSAIDSNASVSSGAVQFSSANARSSNANIRGNKNEINATLEKFINDCNKLGIQYLNEGKTNIKSYTENYKKLLK